MGGLFGRGRCLARSASWANGPFEAQSCNGACAPGSDSIRPASLKRSTQRIQLARRLGTVDATSPVTRSRDGPIRQQRSLHIVAGVVPPCTRPTPRFSLFGQLCPHRVPFDVSQHGVEVVVRLDGKRLETALIQVARSRSVIVCVPTLRMGDRQPTKELGNLFVRPAFRLHQHVPVVGHPRIRTVENMVNNTTLD